VCDTYGLRRLVERPVFSSGTGDGIRCHGLRPLAGGVSSRGKPAAASTHESFSTWFLTLLRTGLGLQPNAQPRIAASIGRVPSWWPVVEHPYRLAMVGAGLVTWPVRRLQGALGRGDELLMVARAGEEA